ncbi:MAG: ATP-binding protein [bacterium]
MYNKETGSDNQQKSYNSIKDFKNLVETPETKPLALVSSTGVINYCNQTFTSVFSLTDGENVSELLIEPNLKFFIDSLSKSQYGSFHFEVFLINSTSSAPTNYFVDVDRVLINQDELMVLVFTSNQERKKIEQRINNLHNALEYGDVAVIITDDKGIINYSSRSFDLILGSSIEFMYNRFLPDVLIEFLNKDESLSIKEAILNKKEWVKMISFIDADQKVWYKEIKLNPIFKNYTESVNFIITANDITNYVQKNQIIKRSEERQRLIINNISDPIVIIRSENNKNYFENANETFYLDFGIKKDEILNKDLNLVNDSTLIKHLISSISELDKSNNNLIKFKYTDEVTKKEFLAKISYADEVYNKIRLYIANYTDLTEQLKAQEQLRIAYDKEIQVSRLKSTFLANMSHEFRTPLNAIAGYSELLEDDLKSKDYDSVLDYTTYLKEGVQRLVKLVENILEISILESGGDEFDFEKTSVNYIIRNIFNIYLPKTLKKSLSFELDLDETEPYVFIDGDKLTKIIDSLVDNALKYNIPNGMVMLRTEVKMDEVTIEISDTGIGIHDEKLDKILKPFEQVDDLGLTRSYEGAGLGLTIAHRLTLRLGGQFSIFSKLKEGTTVSLTFPIIK